MSGVSGGIGFTASDEVLRDNAPLNGAAFPYYKMGIDAATGLAYYVDVAGQWKPIVAGSNVSVVDSGNGLVTVNAGAGGVEQSIRPINELTALIGNLDYALDHVLMFDASTASHVKVPVSSIALPSTAVFSQVVAAGFVDIGDPIQNGARPTGNQFNVAGAVGLDSGGSDSRLRVNFLAAASSGNYTVVGSLRSFNPANWNSDNDVMWNVVEKTPTYFIISTHEVVSITQNLFFDFQCLMAQTAVATPALPEIAQFVALNTLVTLDNIQIEARLIGGQGFRIKTVSGTMTANISAMTTFATDSIFGSNRPGFVITTTLQHPFAWTGQSDADTITGHIYDRTNNKFYEFTVMTNVAPVLSYVQIKRVL